MNAAQLGGQANNELQRQYDAATGTYFMIRNGVLVPVPYYETTVSWVNAGNIDIVCGFRASQVVFEFVALQAVGELAIGESEVVSAGNFFFGAAGSQYNPAPKKFTATGFKIRMGSLGMVLSTSNGTSTGVVPANGNLRVKCWGF